MESSFMKAIKSSLKAKEKGVKVVLKSIYWFAKERISTHEYLSLLSFLDILDCINVQELHSSANAHIVVMLLTMSCKIQLLR